MSTYNGRHRPAHRASRLPRKLRPGYALPTAVTATLAVTATGMSVAQSAPLADALATGSIPLLGSHGGGSSVSDPQMAARVKAEVAEAAADRSGMATRRQEAAVSQVAALGREAARRASRARARAEAAALARAHRWILPVSGAHVTSPFGYRWGRLHAGIDFGAPTGTPLVAMSTGEVIFAGYESGYGYKVEIRYWDGTVSWYGHMSLITARIGQQVAPGTMVGRVGSTGHSTGPHLHLEIHPGGGPAIDPAPWLAQHGIAV